MNIERELLKEILEDDGNGDYFISTKMARKIQSVLDDDEQAPGSRATVEQFKEERGLKKSVIGDQEPADWRKWTGYSWLYSDSDEPPMDYRDIEVFGEALYLAPPKSEPLSVSELNTIYYNATNQTLREQDMRLALSFARVIEKAHGIGVDND